jgi:hypothetical protein
VLNEKNSSEKQFNEFMTLFMETYNKHFLLELKQNKSKINKTKSPKTNCTDLSLGIQPIKINKNI